MTIDNQPREESRIQCLECQKWFRALPTHLRRTHGMDDEDYRLKFLIPVGIPLVCLEWSANQARKNKARHAEKTLTTTGPKKGYRQRKSVKLRREENYKALAKLGTQSAAQIDKTEARRLVIAPYPVTVKDVVNRLGCSQSAAYTFLSYCVRTGCLTRIERGLYGLNVGSDAQ